MYYKTKLGEIVKAPENAIFGNDIEDILREHHKLQIEKIGEEKYMEILRKLTDNAKETHGKEFGFVLKKNKGFVDFPHGVLVTDFESYSTEEEFYSEQQNKKYSHFKIIQKRNENRENSGIKRAKVLIKNGFNKDVILALNCGISEAAINEALKK